jgi:t-SNARE complex subunit (syntaxin)
LIITSSFRLGEETDSLKGDTKASELRIRKNLVSTLTRKFVDVMKEYQNAQQKYKTDIRKKVKRQVHIVKPDASTEEIDAVLKSGGGSGGVLRSAILNVSDQTCLFCHCLLGGERLIYEFHRERRRTPLEMLI